MSAATREVLLFQLGARVFAAAVHDAVRIGTVHEAPADDVVGDSVLGVPFERARGVVVAEGHGVERLLVVDRILGVRSVPEEDVHPLPAFAAACLASGAVTGFAVIDGAPTLLVDLHAVLRERPGAALHPPAA